MQDAFFYIFAVLTLLCGALVIANPFTRSPVTSAMFLVLTIVSMAGLFVLLHAFFLAAVQILVYAGAVIVLFLFVIMFLNLKEEERQKVPKSKAVLGVVAAGSIAAMMIAVTMQFSANPNEAVVEGGAIALGRKLFSDYALPFELISLVLLVAIMGTVLLSRKDAE